MGLMCCVFLAAIDQVRDFFPLILKKKIANAYSQDNRCDCTAHDCRSIRWWKSIQLGWHVGYRLPKFAP